VQRRSLWRFRFAAAEESITVAQFRSCHYGSLLEQLPEPENRVTLDPDATTCRRAAAAHRLPAGIFGSAVFPTSATANPTLTIAALSLRALTKSRLC